MPSSKRPENAAFAGHRRSWRRASAGPAAGQDASTATAPPGSSWRSGKIRSTIAASGGRAGGRGGKRLLGRGGGIDLEARVAQDHSQCAQDLRLVVEHEDTTDFVHATGGPAARAGAGVSLGSGCRKTKVVPWPGCESARSRPPFASTNPRAIANPSSRLASSESVADSNPPTAVVIAVSGVRRSCETDRSSAFWTTSSRSRP
jgi:hypothetical protein